MSLTAAHSAPPAASGAWVVHKFGGSSVADAECFRRVADIIESQPSPKLGIVLSACKGVTDALLNLVSQAERQDEGFVAGLQALRDRHQTIADALLSPEATAAFLSRFDDDRETLLGILRTTAVTQAAAPGVRDVVSGYGEIWSTSLFAPYLARRREGSKSAAGVRWLDARQCVTVEKGPLGPTVQWDISRLKLDGLLADGFAGTLVITGFVATTTHGVPTTLGRNGSDFSGSIFGALLEAAEIIIWTDVDGVLSADPRRVPNAQVIDSLSYNEAMELAYFGAKVIHPQTMAPAVGLAIPIYIRNTFKPAGRGTLICARPDSSLLVKGITTIEGIALLNIEGAGMIGVPGTAHRLFGALREASISVILISQGSSEHSICCAIPQDQADRAESVVREAFARELEEAQIQSVDLVRDLAILSVVGDGMAGTPGVSAKVFNALGAASVNVRAIAQGSSERNISVVVDGKHATRALRATHASFYLSPNTLSIGVIGPGTVGRVLIDQLASQQARLSREFQLELRVRGIMGSSRMLLSEEGVDLGRWQDAYSKSVAPADLDRFVDHLRVDYLPHTVIIDCTADGEVAKHYSSWLEKGIHVVTPNKKANSAAMSYYDSMKAARRIGGTHYLYEGTVGAGLPVIQTLRDLRETGDEIDSIEGIFSGTLAYLFNVYDGSTPFSAIVREAKTRGYTEPDPRDDLSGTDVARKLIILAREMGLRLEMSDVKVDSLVPVDLEKGSIDGFLDGLSAYDDGMKQRFEAAAKAGKVLRYVGRITAKGEATVGLVELDRKHAFANIALTDNVVRFSTARYNKNALIVQGPGAGPEVTAGGVFADLLRLSAYLGARL
ncbi:MAG: Aspartokinase I/homoserine dehydrogenase [Pseudomonadota bacterium]|jgi:aspartokinase/homoserine dehydrogenase 1